MCALCISIEMSKKKIIYQKCKKYNIILYIVKKSHYDITALCYVFIFENHKYIMQSW